MHDGLGQFPDGHHIYNHPTVVPVILNCQKSPRLGVNALESTLKQLKEGGVLIQVQTMQDLCQQAHDGSRSLGRASP
ncbi:hypothetical protein DPEC_G00305170 [Dallia pectoralis]|uniref:Uncharacterized protein n=1 Tax=Dallia pectoralis TaxID=75939 RepID=A0ACC2FDK6_DALPE|nr:hypothetical protein DPEC_G00305170 [Dallia pectoralis]